MPLTTPEHSNYFEYQPTVDLNIIIREYGKTYLNDNIPTPLPGTSNVQWQTDNKGNISACVSGGAPSQASTFAGTITGTIPGSGPFVLPDSPSVMILDRNGQVLTPGLGYTLSGDEITILGIPLEDGDGLNATYWA